MNHFSPARIITIISSLLIAILLMLLPLPNWLAWFWPDWPTLLLLYWLLATPQSLGLISAWLLGLFVDVLTGSLLGEHALGLTVISYLVLKTQRQIRVFPIWQQALVVFILLLLYQGLLFWIQAIRGDSIDIRFWLSVFTSALLWPWLSLIMRDVKNRSA